MMHFPSISDFTLPIWEKFSDSVEIFSIWPFPTKFSYFLPPKFLMTFFSHRLQILNFPPNSADAFLPLFQISPYLRKKFQTSWIIFQIWPFPTKFFDFLSPKFLMTFFSHRLQIINFSPIFAVSLHSPYFGKNIIFPLLVQISLWFRIINVCFTYFMSVSFPLVLPWCIYHHTMHVLDASVHCWQLRRYVNY